MLDLLDPVNQAELQTLVDQKAFTPAELEARHNITAENIEALFDFAKFQFECGNYEGALIGSNQWGIDADTSGTIYTGGGMIRRASMNSHDWIGAISNLEYNSGNLRASVGVDLRRYKGYHYRALNNLMGFDAYYSGGNRNNNGQSESSPGVSG